MNELLLLLGLLWPLGKMYVEPFVKKKAELHAESSTAKNKKERTLGMRLQEELQSKLLVDTTHLLLVIFMAIFVGYKLNHNVAAIDEIDSVELTEEAEVTEERPTEDSLSIDELPQEVYDEMEEHFKEHGIEEAAELKKEEYKREFEKKHQKEIEERATELFLEE